jgi:hypothetical protein
MIWLLALSTLAALLCAYLQGMAAMHELSEMLRGSTL